MRQVEKRHSNEFLPQLIAFTAVGTSFFFFKRYSLMKPSKRNSRLNVSQSERNFKLQYHVFPVLTMWREHTVHLTAENTDEIEINFDFVGSGLSKIFLGLSHTHTHTHTLVSRDWIWNSGTQNLWLSLYCSDVWRLEQRLETEHDERYKIWTQTASF